MLPTDPMQPSEEGNAPSTLHAPVPCPDVLRVEDVIAPDFLKELRLMRDILPELLETFRNDFLPRLAIMRAAIANPDPGRLAQAAHGVKGAAGSMGGLYLASLCGELEQKGRTGTVEGAMALLPQVEVEFEKLCRALEMEIGEQP